MPGTITGDNNQITINISDTIPPENMATIDQNGLLGNTYSKTQFDQSFSTKSEEIDTKIENIKQMVESDFQGTLKPTDVAPTEDGTYKPSVSSSDDKPSDPTSTADWGKVYPNAGNLRAKDGYDTMFYKSGTVWNKSETKIDIPKNEFTEKAYSAIVDLSVDNFSKYKEISGSVTFAEGSGSKFGKMAFYKFTGGVVNFPSDFKIQKGSDLYKSAMTNVIVFWKEFNTVRYSIENLPLEPLDLDPNLISNYSFIGTGGTLLSAISHTGLAAVGNTSGNAIISSGQGISALAQGGFPQAFGFNLTGKTQYKITLSGVTINGFLDIVINGASASDNSKDFITLSKTGWVHTANGQGAAFTNFSTPAGSEIVIMVSNGKVSFTVNGAVMFANRALINTTGGFVGFLLGDSGYSVVQSLKIENS